MINQKSKPYFLGWSRGHGAIVDRRDCKESTLHFLAMLFSGILALFAMRHMIISTIALIPFCLLGVVVVIIKIWEERKK